MSTQEKYQHWLLEYDNANVLWLALDRADKPVNTLNRAVMEELADILSGLNQSSPAGLVITSAKKSGFIAGADVEQFAAINDVNEAVSLVREGQNIFTQLAQLTIPTVAMIDGFCLGGGLELALACDYRVAVEQRQTRLGLPEVKLGIHPGWGGTVRLPALIGAIAAMDLILTGRTLSARAAAKLGLVDAAVPRRQLHRAVVYYLRQQAPVQQASLWRQLTNKQPVRYFLAAFLRRKVSKKANPQHYPAPFAVIDNWQEYGVDSEQAFTQEAQSIGKLLLSSTCQNLVRIFFLREKLKKLGPKNGFSPQHVHVIGAGTMGGDIAAWCVRQGLRVTLQDKEPRLIAPAIKRAYELLSKKMPSERAVEAAMDRLLPDCDGLGIAQADVIIEAIIEDLTAKQALLQQVEQQAKMDAVLATNTSTIPLTDLAKVMKSPQRLVGLHFFNPVALMPLVEVVYSQYTAERIIDKALAFTHKIDRLPLLVQSAPGFLINRILTPYLLESIKLYEEKVPLAIIDKVAVEFGMPIGPVELADMVGLDICLGAAQQLQKTLPMTIPAELQEKVQRGELGKKTGQGFYTYKKGKPQKPPVPKHYIVSQDIQWRLIMAMVNEAQACLREGIISDADMLDIGMVFGSGFAPFRGGPLHYAESLGTAECLTILKRLQHEYGERFTPDAGWQNEVEQTEAMDDPVAVDENDKEKPLS